MAKIKAFSDLQQSKKLAEILPIESADMWWNFYSVTTDDTTPQIIHLDTPWVGNFNWDNKPDNVPCWSLAALLNILDFPALTQEDENKWEVCVREYNNDEYIEVTANNPVDACVKMILKLHEQNLL